MRIVLRNQGRGRVSAVYVLNAQGFKNDRTGKPEYWVIAYWGKWEGFRPDDLSGLQSQVKHEGSRCGLVDKVQKLVSDKLRKGYQVQEELSQLPDWPILPHGQNWRKWDD